MLFKIKILLRKSLGNDVSEYEEEAVAILI